MGIKLITPFEKVDIVQNNSVYSQLYSLKDFFYGITDQEIGAQIVADSTTASNSVTITAEGSFDGANFDTGVNVISTTDIGDGNHDFATFNLGKPYAFVQFKATENNNGAVVDLQMWIGYPTSEMVR